MRPRRDSPTALDIYGIKDSQNISSPPARRRLLISASPASGDRLQSGFAGDSFLVRFGPIKKDPEPFRIRNHFLYVPKTGLEPVCLAAMALNHVCIPVPPPGHIRAQPEYRKASFCASIKSSIYNEIPARGPG